MAKTSYHRRKGTGPGSNEVTINRDVFEEAARIQCTLPEICGLVGCSEVTLRRWVDKEYGKPLREVVLEFRAMGVGSLRRAMWKKALADEDTSMQKWLSKNTKGLDFAEKHELSRIEAADREEIKQLIPMALKVLEGEVEEDEEDNEE